MTSEDGLPGIKLDDFIEMWTADGTQLIEQDRQDDPHQPGIFWLLYAVYFPESTQEYGRHMAMLLKVDGASQVILKHDLENLMGSVIGGGHRDIQDWFSKHVGFY